MGKISVIIPVYNCEKTIIGALESIDGQTYKDFEVIIINDGSTDNSDSKIREYLRKVGEERYKYFSTNHNGVSSARNLGLENVTGEIITFLDADDSYEFDYFENIIRDMKDNDIIFYSYTTIFEDKKNVHSLKNKNYTDNKKEFFETLDKEHLFNAIWNKAYSKSIIGNVRFNLDLDLGEDLEFLSKCYYKAKKYTYINKSFYNYNVSFNGLGFKKRENIFELKIEMYKNLNLLYNKNNYNKKYLNSIYIKAYISGFIYLEENNRLDKGTMIEYQEKCFGQVNLNELDLSVQFKTILWLFKTKNLLLLKVLCKVISKLERIDKKKNFGLIK